MPITTIEVPAGSYATDIDGVAGSITVPALIAGSIAQTAPNVGDTLTVTGSNASASATFQWQRDGVDISGAIAATYDTTGQLTGQYRRGIRDGTQGPVYTAAVAVVAGSTVLVTDEFDTGDGYALDDLVASSPRWTESYSSGYGVATINPLGSAYFHNSPLGHLNNSIILEYTGDKVTSSDHFIEAVVGSYDGDTSVREDLRLQVRVTGNAGNAVWDGINVFVKRQTSEIFFREYNGGVFKTSGTGQNQLISESLTELDKLSLEVIGTDAFLKKNGVQIGATMTGVTVTNGTVAMGAYLANGASNVRGFRLNSVTVGNL